MQFATVPMDQFPLSWRFIDPRYDVPPPIHLAQVKPIAPTDAQRLWDLIHQLHQAVPFTEGYFRSVVSTRIAHVDGKGAEDRRVRRWLYQRGVPFRQQVYLSYQPELAIQTTWKVLVKYWTSFYYPISDDVTVIDGSFIWALLFHHEEEVFFGTNVAPA